MKIFIADDEKKVRNAIRILVELEDQNHICAEAANSQELFSYLNFCKPDILLLDHKLPGLIVSPESLQSIRAAVPGIRIILMSVDIHENMQQITADAILCKCSSPQVFLSTLEQFRPIKDDSPYSPVQSVMC
jgi:DNA-binding NarL/FixJ family response regulator